MLFSAPVNPKIARPMGKGKDRQEEYLYSAVYTTHSVKALRHWITQFYMQITSCLHFLCKRVHQMAPPLTEIADIQLQLTTHLSTLMADRIT